MRTALLSFTLLLFCCQIFAQEAPKPNKNYLFFQAGNNTPIIGINYQRAIFLSKKASSFSHFEVGGGIGLQPFVDIYTKSKLPFLFSHSISYILGNERIAATFNYSGIVSAKDRFLNKRYLYTPNPSVGIRLRLWKVYFSANYNAYFYSKIYERIENENELVKRLNRKVALFPGISLGFRF